MCHPRRDRGSSIKIDPPAGGRQINKNMTKRDLKQLIDISFDKTELNEPVIKRIGDALTRSELKDYIRLLKLEISRRSVTVTNALPLGSEQKKELEALFSDKKVSYNTDKSLLLGTRIVSGDIVYNMNLKQQLTDLETYVSK